MIALGPLIDAVQRNCHIADAQHARELTMCTYLLEMREFYRWEAGLPLGAAPPRADVAPWLAEREALWDTLAEAEFGALPAAGAYLEPFASSELNRALQPQGLVYGAGIGRFGRPHFFLGRLERSELSDGLAILVSGCEYARDLAALPAVLQGDTVVVRREALRQWLWESAEAWGVKETPGAMRRALAAYGYFDDGAAALERMTDAEIATLVLHERGEHAAGRVLGAGWEEMLAGLLDRRAEILARAVRDHWADCCVTLPARIERQAWAALHFWFANLEGMRRELFPSMLVAGQTWTASGDAAPIVAAAAAGADHWPRLAQALLDGYRTRASTAAAEMAAMTRDIAAIAL